MVADEWGHELAENLSPHRRTCRSVGLVVPPGDEASRFTLREPRAGRAHGVVEGEH